MTSITLRTAGFDDIPAIAAVAEQTWFPSYGSIISQEQIRYMLDTIYNAETLRQVQENGSQEFILLHEDKKLQGFAAFGPRPDEPDVYKLHKLYVLPETHGKGFGKQLIDEVIRRLKERGIRVLDLNVNRYNRAKTFYERMGFRVIREEDIPIGPYWMNDYVMRYELQGVKHE